MQTAIAFLQDTPASVKSTPSETLTLAQSKIGQQLILVAVNGGKRMQERLISMGFPTGCSFHVHQNNHGAVVIGCACNRLAIGAGMANKLVVRPVA